ncbi:MAG: TetR/AcrR family transcriptional regulator [Gammaproteobacteria bacterium]|nr:TetR/AcrR family transcriptional regulator [Gammaproteobacteria bacterium]
MEQNTKDNLTEDIRQQILQAAENRFKQYGYNKTTMVEIAKDCSMSAANLYRYFENKLAIGASLACDCLDQNIEGLKKIILNNTLSASERLLAFILETFNYTHTQWSETPRMNEMVIAICHERLDIVDQHYFQKQALLITLIKDGNRGGTFNVAEPEKAAEAILVAITMFDIPLFMPMFSRDNFERKVKNLVSLLLNGLLKRPE